MRKHYFMSSKQQGKTYSAIDFAATTGHNLMLGTSNPRVWTLYLKSKYPQIKFQIVENGIIINPKDSQNDNS